MWSEKGFWSKWQLRFSVVLSLFLQLILVWLGKRRKRLYTPWLNIVIWSTYLSAGWFATVSLSTLLRSKGGLSNEIIVFWTPFLILHLGGPDTITAYSLEDNETWLRHLLGLVIQVGTAFYINYKFRTNSPLQLTATLILIAGIIKYGERIWILRAASSKGFANFVFSKRENYSSDVDGSRPMYEKMKEYLSRIHITPKARHVYEAYLSLKMFTSPILGFSFKLYKEVFQIFTTHYNSAEDAFAMVDTELGFLFDLLYTKRPLFRTKVGVILRCICFLSLISTIVVFSIILHKRDFSKVDIFITYLLLVGAIFLDIYTVISNLLSRWTVLWLSKNRKWVAKFLYLRSFLLNAEMGFGVIGQHSLIDYCVKSKKDNAILKFFDTNNIFQKYWYSRWEVMNLDIKKFIYSHLLKKRERYEKSDFKDLTKLLAERGDHAIQKWGIDEDLLWSLDEVHFNHSLLLWHIATDLCYFDDFKRYGGSDVLSSKSQISLSLSDYMVYLLVVRSSMLPEDIHDRRNIDTREQLTNFCPKGSPDDARSSLLDMAKFSTEFSSVGPFKNKSVVSDSFRLHKQLQSFVENYQWDVEEKWEMISQVWVEMLTYAASRCSWKQHTHQLIHGKELLTHVSLLMMHLGLSSNMPVKEFPQKDKDAGFYPPWKWDDDLIHLEYYLL